MPAPKGWTEGMVRKRDELVEALMEDGVPAGRSAEERARAPRERAYAIATAQVEQMRRARSA